MIWKKLQQQLRQTFHLSNAQSHGLLALLLLITLCIIAPNTLKRYYRHIMVKKLDHTEDVVWLEKNLAALQANACNVTPININRATVEQLTQITAIRLPLAQRIIRYRDKLGGFISEDQYKEVYSLTKQLTKRLTQQAIIAPNYIPRKLSLNHASFKELVAHPYITAALAKEIIQHRKKYGRFMNLQELSFPSDYKKEWKQWLLVFYLTL